MRLKEFSSLNERLMEKTFWNHVQDLKNSLVEPMDTTVLETKVIKIILGGFLAQTFMMCLWWSAANGIFYPWLFLIGTVLQNGWAWNKVTSSWKNVHYNQVPVQEMDIEKGQDSALPKEEPFSETML